jgi:uncharacterized protein (TIGR02001 family)
MTRRARRAGQLALAVALVAAAAGASAQVSGVVAVVSDDRFRGVSLSNDQPALQADVVDDLPGGAYLGVFASDVELYGVGSPQLEVDAYAGYARRLSGDLSVDLGVAQTAVVGYVDYNYLEWHLGATRTGVDGSIGARLSYAPDYFGQSLRTWYAEINGTYRLGAQAHLLGHAGYLRIDGAPPGALPSNADARAGLEWAVADVRVQFARVQSQGSAIAYPVAVADHGTWLVEVRAVF